MKDKELRSDVKFLATTLDYTKNDVFQLRSELYALRNDFKLLLDHLGIEKVTKVIETNDGQVTRKYFLPKETNEHV